MVRKIIKIIEFELSDLVNMKKQIIDVIHCIVVDSGSQRTDITLPAHLKTLRFDIKKSLSPGTLPESLQELIFYEYFDEPLNEGVLPGSLRKLVFGRDWNHPLQGILPGSLTSLVFGFNFNQFIEFEVLPVSLTDLEFGTCFNQKLCKRNILQSLFQKNIMNPQYLIQSILPGNLTRLKFGYDYEQKIYKDILPESLTILDYDKVSHDNEYYHMFKRILSDPECM